MKKLPTISIKGKMYVLVKDRIMAFQELYPNGEITTEIVKNDDSSVVVKAMVCPDRSVDDERRFTGHSEAYRGVGQMGQVPVEVAETSAVGRSLAMLGIGIIDSVASADEMKKASTLIENARTGTPSSIVDYQDIEENMPRALPLINNAKKEFNRSQYVSTSTKPASDKQKDMIMGLCVEKGVKTTREELDKMTIAEASQKIKGLQTMKNKVESNSEEKAKDSEIMDIGYDPEIPIIEDEQ
jgi:hypothetical protein